MTETAGAAPDRETAPRHLPDDARVPAARDARPRAVHRGPRPRHDPPRRGPGGHRRRASRPRCGPTTTRSAPTAATTTRSPAARRWRKIMGELMGRGGGLMGGKGGSMHLTQRRARRDGLVRDRRRAPADRARARPGPPSCAGPARSRSASSATARPTSGRSTRRSTWPPSGSCRSSSCARTTSTWSTRRSAP